LNIEKYQKPLCFLSNIKSSANAENICYPRRLSLKKLMDFDSFSLGANVKNKIAVMQRFLLKKY